LTGDFVNWPSTALPDCPQKICAASSSSAIPHEYLNPAEGAVDYQEEIAALIPFDPGTFVLPEAVLMGDEEEITAIEFDPGKFSLTAYSTAEDAALALEIGRSYGLIGNTLFVKKVQPIEWLEFVRRIGPSLVEILVVYRVNEVGQSFWHVPTLDFLRKVNQAISRST
jgi:hypothetical protein